MDAEWKQIPNWPYEASSGGLIRRAPPQKQGVELGRNLSQYANPVNGYCYVVLSDRTRRRRTTVHVLVLEAFHGLAGAGQEARHLNGNRRDNRAANLGWGTRIENAADRLLHGTDWTGDKHKNRRLSAALVTDLRRRHANGEFTYSGMARSLGVDVQTVRKAILGESWKSIGEERGGCYSK